MNTLITGIGGYLPQKCVTNFDLPASLETSDEWIRQRTGICERHIADAEEFTSDLAVKAAMDAISMAKLTAQDIDLIIVATATPDYTFPSTACIVQNKLGIDNCISFDVNAACSGFLYALDIANSYIKSHNIKHALVIGSETFSRILNLEDRSTCILFGDGAGAVILSCNSDEHYNDFGLKYCKLGSNAKYFDALKTTGGISRNQHAGVITMNGREVFKFAVEKFKESFNDLLRHNNLNVDDIDLVIPHQANLRIIESLIDGVNISKEKLLITVNKHANTSAASIPLAMSTVRDEIFQKKNIVLLSMGAGFTWGSALIKFS